MATDCPVYEIDGVGFSYSVERALLKECSLVIGRGDFVGILGPNGAGKSTLFNLMTGVLKPQIGAIRLKSKSLADWPRRALAQTVAVVPQTEHASFPFSVGEIVLMGRTPHLRGYLALETDEDRAIAHEALETVGLSGYEHRPISQLSGGERQLVLIARAIAQQSEVLLLDEPTASLDLAHQQQILRIVESLNRERGTTVVMVAHDLNLAGLYCRTLAVLHAGRFIASGPPADVLQPGVLSDAYGAELWFSYAPDGSPLVGLQR